MEEGGGSVDGVCRAGKEIEEEKKRESGMGWDGMMSSSCKSFNWTRGERCVLKSIRNGSFVGIELMLGTQSEGIE